MAKMTKAQRREQEAKVQESLKARITQIPKPPPTSSNNKYTLEVKTEAMTMWCLGYSYREIAANLNLGTQSVPANWKMKKDPSDWEAAREKHRKKQIEKTARATIDAIEDIRAKQQKRFEKVQDVAAASLARQASAGELPAAIAADTLFRAAEEEKKLHLPLESLIPRPQGSSLAFGLQTKPTGEVGALITLNNMFEEAHGTRSNKALEPASQSGQPDRPADPKDV